MVQVRQRICDKDGNKGTVRYVGPVATSKKADTVYAGEIHQNLASCRFTHFPQESNGTTALAARTMAVYQKMAQITAILIVLQGQVHF